MGEIKSAREIAREKVAQIGEATPEERLRWKYTPEGEKLAVKYLKENLNLLLEIQRYQENARGYVSEAAADVLTPNITLPKDELAKKTNRRAMDGLKLLKTDKVSVENVFSQMRRLFSHYLEQGQPQKKQAYAALKAEFQAKLQQAIKQQMGSAAGFKIDVESQPQFQEEWRKLQTKLELQYIKLLDEYKRELRATP